MLQKSCACYFEVKNDAYLVKCYLENLTGLQEDNNGSNVASCWTATLNYCTVNARVAVQMADNKSVVEVDELQ